MLCRGFSQEWYSGQWGHYLLRRLLALRHYFAQSPDSLQVPDSTPPSPPSNSNPISSASPPRILVPIPSSTTKSESEDQSDQSADEDSSQEEATQILSGAF